MGTFDSSISRDYQSSHPWISFRVDLNQCTHDVWMLLGEIRSKCEYIAGVPLLPETAQRLYTVYLSKGAHATTAIEGNTLSEDEVLQRVNGKLELSKSREYLGVEVDNILKAYDEIFGAVNQGMPLQLTPERIKYFNKLVLSGLDLEEGVVPGQCREHNVGVARYRGAPPQDCEFLLDHLCSWLNDLELPDEGESTQFALAVLKALLAHVYIAWIHPFGDGNGRTARLVEVQLLLQSHDVPLPAAFVLSNHYNQTRDRYYRELDRSSRSGGDLEHFFRYSLQGYADGLRDQLSFIREQQLLVTWEHYVHNVFRDQNTQMALRRKHVVLDMPDDITPRNKLTGISARVMSEYAGKTDKTLSRDLNALRRMGLILREGKGYRPNRDLIKAWIPPRSV
jgi:Fic family protein